MRKSYISPGQLIHRNTRQVELTQAGHEYYVMVRQMLQDFDQASHELKLFKTIRRGKVSVAALPSLCGSVLAKIFSAFHETYPEIRLDIKDIPGAQIMDALTNREVDLACTYAQHGPGIDAYPFMKDSLALLCRKDSELAQYKMLKWKQLEERPLIATAIAYVRAGLGVAVLPTAGISAQLSLELARVDLVDPEISRDISVLSLKDYSLSPAAVALREMILPSADR